MEGKNHVTRRSTLKKITATGIGLSATGLGVTELATLPVTAADPDKTWTKTARDTPDTDSQDWEVSQASTAGWYGAEYMGSDEWRHSFRVQADASTRTSDGGVVSWVEYQSMAVTQGSTTNFTVSHHDDYHGVYPSPDDLSDSYDHENLIIDITKEAVSELNVIADFAFTASEIADKLIPDESPTDDPDYLYEDEFDYSGNPQSDVGMYRWYYPFTDTSEAVFDIFTRAGEPDMVAEVENQFTFHIKEGLTPKEGKFNNYDSVTTTSAGTEIFQPKEGWLIEKIPYAKIKERGPELGLTADQISDHLERQGKPLFFAHDAPIALINR
jgi:hypothetical protein